MALPLVAGQCDSEPGECELDLPPGHLPCEIARAQASSDDLEWEDCYEHPVWPSRCFEDAQSAGLTRDGLVWEGPIVADFASGRAPFTITDQASWDDLLAEWYFVDEGSLPSVDFGANVLVVAQDYVSSTCGASMTDHGLFFPADPQSKAFVYLYSRDTTGACRQVCDQGWSYGVIYAIPRDRAYPTVCIERFATCDVD